MMRFSVGALMVCVAVGSVSAQDSVSRGPFTMRDVFDLQWAFDPQIAPDGQAVAYVRSSFDIMTDGMRSGVWIVKLDGSQRPLSDGVHDVSSPRWSPDGGRIAYVSSAEHGSDIIVRWLDTGQQTSVVHLEGGASGLAWSPDGKWIAYLAFVAEEAKPFASMPAKPAGADWGPPIKFSEALQFQLDGAGDVRPGHRHLFVVPADGGAARQVTDGPYNDGSPVWSPDGKALLFSGNRRVDAEYDPVNTEVYEVSLESGVVKQLTDRKGPDNGPAVSPDGKLVAYTGFDDRHQGYQVTHLYVMNRDGGGAHVVAGQLDRDVQSPVWSADGRSVFVDYDDEGDTRIAQIGLDGKVTPVASGVGGLDLGRPYSGGMFTVSRGGRVAFTQTDPDHPADVAVSGERGVERLTRLNDALLGHRTLASVEEVHWASSYDGKQIEGWVVKPPGFERGRKYPLVLEIHGGPFDNYGARWGAEMQLYAAAGYVVLYTNPRGSTSYGEAFGNAINHDYPDHDYDDLMSGVDAIIARGYIDQNQLFVTGGSGGGVLTAWIVGHTNRFRAAVVQKPVINWYSWVLTTDMAEYGLTYWFEAPPWQQAQHYMDRSPISYVGNVSTPTMVMVGEADHRTPASEAEQFYEALKLRRVPSALVRIPNASHEISATPSHLAGSVAYILAWFDRYRSGRPERAAEGRR